MAINMNQVAIPLSYFYLSTDVTACPTSTEVDAGGLIELDASGVPTDPRWVDVGATIGEGSLEFTKDTIELSIEQVSGIPKGGILFDNDSVTLTIPMAQQTGENMRNALQGDLIETTGGKTITVGGKTTPTPFACLLVAEHRAGSGIFHQYCVYYCINQEGVTLSFSKADAMTYEMSVRGLVDPDRRKGDQLAYYHIADVE